MKADLYMSENSNCSYQLEAISCYCSIYETLIEVSSKNLVQKIISGCDNSQQIKGPHMLFYWNSDPVSYFGLCNNFTIL